MSRFWHGLAHAGLVVAQIAVQLVISHYGMGTLASITGASVLSAVQGKLALYNHPKQP